jgi:hypothetical protein
MIMGLANPHNNNNQRMLSYEQPIGPPIISTSYFNSNKKTMTRELFSTQNNENI